ncbi:hypothetical protein SAMN02745244_01929 [Tessaracoccus bendigoensis DSM 12906]|uniref:PPi-type phosphoenolpyruvate carboxykinase lobe 2 domain-containing protein n=1 Tax=Tessaracoccus bendigoensis DSM 12906 TaxID=1123357 RepID=A0A1M6HA74_9ACTN|nr:hypothetical protein [Tessaracoccus bendigoensis]SHJ19108.1 hypothetical protein SAMN02745244_01929 [Tessaracoccus bendigoensis DSM 12906]
MASFAETAAINLRLGLLGIPLPDSPAVDLVRPVLARQREFNRRLQNRLPAVDSRIQSFLDDYLTGTDTAPRLPRQTLVLDQPGLARAMSLPVGSDTFASEQLTSYRLVNGILHNPANDRRTTKGVFHIAEGGLPVQDDKLAVPRDVFGRLLEHAFDAPDDALVLPYTSEQPDQPKCWVSLLLRPIVVPEVPGYTSERRMETRFLAPATLMANLDFVEGIFGNGGDPYLPDNDSSLNPESWTGHTGLVVLAPHLTKLTKKELGLPHWDDATERQRRDGMCWTSEDERYNGGSAFKACARDERGVIVTVIADNYFGYCKKEVKAQISYAANLLGMVEEEHAGGAIAFPRYNLGQTFTDTYADDSYRIADVIARNPERFVRRPEGHAVDLEQPHIVLVPEHSSYSLRDSTVSWTLDGVPGSIQLRANTQYVGPDGYIVELTHLAADGDQWTLLGTSPVATSAHKPATVSGGGKSEISKSITDAFVNGNAYVNDFTQDMEQVAAIINHDFSTRFVDPACGDHRALLSDERSVGSVIKLLTPSRDYTDEYNAWVEAIPHHIKELVFVVKRFYHPEWGSDWASHFSVGRINGRAGHALRLDGDKITVNMLRVGFAVDGSWRLFGLRHDFHPATKVQTEDDITASIIVPGEVAGRTDGLSRKYVTNCEQLLFQRPDDAIHRGYDKQTEIDIAAGAFISNFEPLTRSAAKTMVDDAVNFSRFTEPMQSLIRGVADGSRDSAEYFVSSADPRLINGKRSKNPRYLQVRPDISRPRETAIAEMVSRMHRRLPMEAPLRLPVDVVAAGRRNNAAEDGVPPLCCYAPLHFMERPELFMEFISSMTGKSPSTTGAGSEGAMTKGPFNALPSIIDLNAAFLDFTLTGYDGWLSSAGVIGPNVRVDHDISLLVPEVFSRMTPQERDAAHLIAEGALERVEDFEIDGETIEASRLGYRMTAKFQSKYFGRIFMHPHVVFSENMLRPELQDADAYAESVRTIVTTHQHVAKSYIEDGTISLAVPPIKALLEIMANGQSAEGLGLQDPAFRAMFDREQVLASDWYSQRLAEQASANAAHASRGIAAMTRFLTEDGNGETAERLGIEARITTLQASLDSSTGAEATDSLIGTIGRQVTWRLE